MAIQIVTIANSIAAISVSGVTIKDIDEIPEEVTSRDCPILIPRPDGYVSGFTYDPVTQGGGATALADVNYNLRYSFLYAPLGDGRDLMDNYSGMVTKVGLIIDALIISDAITGVIDLQLTDVSDFGPVADPTGNMFHGCTLTVSVLEFIN